MQLVRPAAEHLPSYTDALQRGWSPDTMRPEAAAEELARIQADAQAFLASTEDRVAAGPPIRLPDGSAVPRLPGFRRWLWDDGQFCGSIGLRWQHGTPELPPHCLGHIGYSVVPWQRRRGLATAALAQLLPEARALGLPWVSISTDLDNSASQRVILANGGVLVQRFALPAAYAPRTEGLRYRITL